MLVQIGRNRRQRLSTGLARGADMLLDGGGVGEGLGVIGGSETRAVKYRDMKCISDCPRDSMSCPGIPF
jgi:hypothetical protein